MSIPYKYTWLGSGMALGARNNGGTYLFYTESFDRSTSIFMEHLMPIALLKDMTTFSKEVPLLYF